MTWMAFSGLQQAQMAQLVLAGRGAHRHIAGRGFLFHALTPDKSGRIDPLMVIAI